MLQRKRLPQPNHGYESQRVAMAVRCRNEKSRKIVSTYSLKLLTRILVGH